MVLRLHVSLNWLSLYKVAILLLSVHLAIVGAWTSHMLSLSVLVIRLNIALTLVMMVHLRYHTVLRVRLRSILALTSIHSGILSHHLVLLWIHLPWPLHAMRRSSHPSSVSSVRVPHPLSIHGLHATLHGVTSTSSRVRLMHMPSLLVHLHLLNSSHLHPDMLRLLLSLIVQLFDIHFVVIESLRLNILFKVVKGER